MGIRTRVGAVVALAALLAAVGPAGASPPDPVSTQLNATPATTASVDSAVQLRAVAPDSLTVALTHRASAVDSVKVASVASRTCDRALMASQWRFDINRTRPPSATATSLTTTPANSLTVSPNAPSRFRQRHSDAGERSTSPTAPASDSISHRSADSLVRRLCALTRT